MHARHVRIGIPGLQYPHLFTCMPRRDVVVCAPASDRHDQLTMLTRKFKVELDTMHVRPMIRNHPCSLLLSIQPTHPFKANTGLPTKLPKNKSLSSGVSELSRTARNAGSTKCANRLIHHEA